jgi:hypothetical protein
MADSRAAYLSDVLTQYGLSSLISWAEQAIVNDWSNEQFIIELYKRDEFKKRFPAIFQLESKGRPPVSVDEYLAYEKYVSAQAAMWGIPLSKEEVDNMLANEVSNVEVQARFDLASEAMYETPQEDINELIRMSNGSITSGQVMKYFMDPQKELGVLQSQFRQAQIAGAAVRTGWGQLTQAQAERLQETGMTRDQAKVGFAELAKMDEVFSPFTQQEALVTPEEQVAFLAGDADAATKIENRVRSRLAEFGGSSEFAAGKGGFAVGAAQQ